MPGASQRGHRRQQYRAILQAKGDLDGALKYSQRALSIDERVYGPEHPDVASTTVATMLSDWGRLRRTFRYQEEHVAGCGAKELERLLRDRATDLGSAFSLLAELLSYFAGSRVIDRLLEEVGRASNGLPISGKSQNAAAASAPR